MKINPLLYFRRLVMNTSIKAVAIVCHGFGEHAGNYAGLAENLEGAG
jgi:alpha-beta hydrolase superfamily lysophospholipase